MSSHGQLMAGDVDYIYDTNGESLSDKDQILVYIWLL